MPQWNEFKRLYENKGAVFINISLDEDQHTNEWLNAMEKERLTGDNKQFRLVKPHDSQLVKFYKISEIPKYMIFLNGSVVNENFKKPSDKEFEPELLKLLAKY